MKQGSAFPYISYADARRTRIGFSLMTHCICHERGTRFNAVPGSTPNMHEQQICCEVQNSYARQAHDHAHEQRAVVECGTQAFPPSTCYSKHPNCLSIILLAIHYSSCQKK
jgi:hypothetical protein